MVPYVATTKDIRVTVRPVYLDNQSDYFEKRFVFGYFIRIENESLDEVQLLRRRWVISEAYGKVQEVEGDGVIGQQPILKPGGAHQYRSYCVLNTMEGVMEGHYLMQRANGERFRVVIPRFDLRARAN